MHINSKQTIPTPRNLGLSKSMNLSKSLQILRFYESEDVNSLWYLRMWFLYFDNF